jgi:UDP-N-acetylmuramate dehydrogenase
MTYSEDQSAFPESGNGLGFYAAAGRGNSGYTWPRTFHGCSRRALSGLADTELMWDEPLARHTTFRIGGPVACFARPRTEQALTDIIRKTREHEIPHLILGGGSNVLPPDDPWDVLVIQLTLSCSRIQLVDSQGTGVVPVYVGAGVRVAQLVRFCLVNRLEGIEYLVGIPGTLGGAVVMNAGVREGSISDSLLWIDVIDEEGKYRRIYRCDLTAGYRSMGLSDNWIVLGCCVEMRPSMDDGFKSRLVQIMGHRKETQPLALPSAGCVFKNPEGFSAGALIDRSGLKGVRIGDAEISEKHANWIVNRGSASASDVLALVRLMEEKVFESSGIRLERELRVLGRG